MKIIRNLATFLALTSVTAAIAGDSRWFAGKYRPAVSPSASSMPTLTPVTAAFAGSSRWFAGKYRPAASPSWFSPKPGTK